jgi:hypothetical protein
MTQTKTARIASFDRQLKDLETQADALQFDIDALPEWAEVTALVVAYEWNERRYTARLADEFNNLVDEIAWLIFLHWAELKHSGQI